MKCRHCHTDLNHPFLDLGFAPPSNAYLTAGDLQRPEKFYPLKVMVCNHCWLVQTEDYAQADELFNADYAYFSSTSKLWLAHAQAYTDHITPMLGLNAHSLVMEVASNDGYLLKNFMAAGIPCLGIEPTASTALAAEQLGIPVLREFFGLKLAQQLAAQGRQADLIIGNNVYAHVPDINDFTQGMQAALKPTGSITLEFPHLMELLKHNQFDTVYHEHFSYLSLIALERVFGKAGLRAFDAKRLPTHGGSLRLFVCLTEATFSETEALNAIRHQEKQAGLDTDAAYLAFAEKPRTTKSDLLALLGSLKQQGKMIAAYGAPAKGNTLLNYCGVSTDLIDFTVDRAPSKQGRFLPGSRIPIYAPEAIAARKPDFIVILPWNLVSEITNDLAYTRAWGGRFILPMPVPHLLDEAYHAN